MDRDYVDEIWNDGDDDDDDDDDGTHMYHVLCTYVLCTMDVCMYVPLSVDFWMIDYVWNSGLSL